MFSSCVVVAGEHGRLDYRLCRPYLWLGRISVPAWLRFLNTEYVEVIFRGLLATKAVRSCFFVFFVVFFAMAQLSFVVAVVVVVVAIWPLAPQAMCTPPLPPRVAVSFYVDAEIPRSGGERHAVISISGWRQR